MPNLSPVTIVVRGKHDTGKTTVARLIEEMLRESGFSDVQVHDLPPLPHDMKDRFIDRFERNRERPVRIVVELEK